MENVLFTSPLNTQQHQDKTKVGIFIATKDQMDTHRKHFRRNKELWKCPTETVVLSCFPPQTRRLEDCSCAPITIYDHPQTFHLKKERVVKEG